MRKFWARWQLPGVNVTDAGVTVTRLVSLLVGRTTTGPEGHLLMITP